MTEPLPHAVLQTIAAERLEGWVPSEENVTALEKLASDRISFAEYLATFRARYPPPVGPGRRPRPLRRKKPYLIPGTTLLRNSFGADSAQMLNELEFVSTAGRMVQWFRDSAGRSEPADARDVHRHLFGDVYSWAGQFRTTELRRGDHAFAWQSSIADAMRGLQCRVLALAEVGASYDNPRLAYELARLYADYNQIHPFREGNGRTGALMLHAVAMACGRHLDFTGVSRAEWYAASADSMPFHRDGRASHRPLLYLLLRTVSR